MISQTSGQVLACKRDLYKNEDDLETFHQTQSYQLQTE